MDYLYKIGVCALFGYLVAFLAILMVGAHHKPLIILFYALGALIGYLHIGNRPLKKQNNRS